MGRFFRTLPTLAVLPACLAAGCTAPPERELTQEQRSDGFVPLFDGESFEGWEGNQEFFRVEDEAVVAGDLTRDIPRNEFLCTTREYGDFELRLQARTSREDANGGIQLRSRRIPNSSEVVGYQADIAVEPTRNIWGALYDEARRRAMLAVADQEGLARVYRPGAWNDYRIRAEGPRIRIWINGYQTVDYSEADPDIELTGIIGVQIHSGGPAEVRYRNIVIKPLPQSEESEPAGREADQAGSG